MAEKTLDTLFHDTLKDIHHAERKILKSLPKMQRAAQSPELKAAFGKHKDGTGGQIECLQQESRTDEDLTPLADTAVNEEALRPAAE